MGQINEVWEGEKSSIELASDEGGIVQKKQWKKRCAPRKASQSVRRVLRSALVSSEYRVQGSCTSRRTLSKRTLRFMAQTDLGT